MMQCQGEFGTVFLGGCCGTDTRLIQSLARRMVTPARAQVRESVRGRHR
jgi:hypothetical protein